MPPTAPSPIKAEQEDHSDHLNSSEDEDDLDYEQQRLLRIAANEALLLNLGLAPGVSALTGASLKPEPKQPASKRAKPQEKRKREVKEEDGGARRRSSRIAGLEADGEKAVERQQVEETAFAQARILAKRIRAPKMALSEMVETSSLLGSHASLSRTLSLAAASATPRPKAAPALFGVAEGLLKRQEEREEADLKKAFGRMELKRQVRVTGERVYSIAVHPMPTKTLVFVGDKRGQLGIWDASAPLSSPKADDDDTAAPPTPSSAKASAIRSSPVDGDETLVSVKEEVDEKAMEEEGSLWRMQAHSTNSISCLKVDPVDGGSLYSTSYDCSLRRLSLSSSLSTEVYRLQDEDALLNSFDLTPDGKQAWLVDSRGGLSHVDLAGEGSEGKRRRWVISGATNNAMKKLGGVSINPVTPWLISTAGNDRYLRLWDTRHFSSLKMQPYEILDTAPTVSIYDELPIPAIVNLAPNTHTQTLPTEELDYEGVYKALEKGKAKGMFRGEWFHGKSCSSGYWDPRGRKVLTTSYDDKLRIFDITREQISADTPIPGGMRAPSKSISHDCQCGRWVSVLKAQWSGNVEYGAHFSVGNMTRKISIYTAGGTMLANLASPEVTAVPAVTQQHPNIVNHVIGGNASGKCQFWGPKAE